MRLCRALKRQQLRTGERNFGPDDIDRALQRKTRAQVVLSPAEERVVAIHEAGHALLAMLVEHATPPERISIAADMEGALGYVLRAARAVFMSAHHVLSDMNPEYWQFWLGALMLVGVSERRRERVDAEVGQILEQEQTRAHALLAANQPLLASLVETLLARKVLDRAELRALTQGGPHG